MNSNSSDASLRSPRHPVAAHGLLAALMLGLLLPTNVQPATVDLMVVYTPAARRNLGGTDAVATRLEEAIDRTNECLSNSLVTHRVRLIHHEEIPYTESDPTFFEWPDSVDFAYLHTAGDGVMDEVFVLRDLYAADAVVFIIGPEGGKGGRHFSMVGALSMDNYTFPHEIGHLFGCAHAIGDSFWKKPPGTPKGDGQYPFSHGWHFFIGEQRMSTVMAYAPADGWRFMTPGITVPYYSNPNVFFQGLATGDPEDGDNARTIELMGDDVAERRTARPPAPKPLNVLASDLAGPAVTVTWDPVGEGYLYRVFRRTLTGALYQPLGVWQTSTSFDDATGEPRMPYRYYVQASKVGAFSPSGFGAMDVGSRDLVPPQNVQASDGLYTDRVRVTWDPMKAAAAYRVFRSETRTGSKLFLSNWQAAASFEDTPPLGNVDYYYWVKAALSIDGTGETDFSEPNHGFRRLIGPICGASDGTSTAGVNVSWAGASGATHYQVSRATDATETWTAISDWQTEQVFVDTTAAPGLTYFYRVRSASNASGADGSNYGSHNTGWRQFEVPSGVQASDSTSTETVLVTWNPAAGAAHYQVARSEAGGSGSTTPLSEWMPGATQYFAVTPPGVEYRFFVRASRSATGLSATAYSAGALGSRRLDAPTAVQASDGTHTDRVVVSWGSVPGATHYQVSRSSTLTGAKTVVSLWQTDRTCIHSVSAGSSGFYWVRASADATGRLPSDYGGADMGSAGLPAPTNLQASAGTYSDHVALTWQRLAGTYYYKVYRSTSLDGTRTGITSWVLQASTCSDAGAQPAQVYYYWVKAATTSAGADESAFSGPASGFRTLPAPSGVQAADGTRLDAIDVQWNPVAGASCYRVHRASAPGGNYLALGSWQTATLYADPEGEPGHTYYYRVTAATSLTGQQESAPSGADGGFKKMPPPSPVNASHGNYTDKIRVWWQAVPEAYYFQVFRSDSATGPMDELNGLERISSFNDLTAEPGRFYYYRVAGARSGAGFGPTDRSAPAVGWISPSAPERPTVSDGEFEDRVRVTWPVLAEGLYYRVWRKDAPNGTLVAIGAWQTASTYDDFAVDPGHTYYYAIQAANDSTGQGASTVGPAYGGSRRVAPPGPVTATDGMYPDRVVVVWPAVPNAYYYGVYRARQPDGAVEPLGGWDRATRFEDTTAELGFTYAYSVRAARGMTGYGESGVSAADLGWRQPPAPAGVSATDGTELAHVRVTWSSVFPGAFYQVSRSATATGPKVTLSGWIAALEWSDATAVAGQTAYYYVRASAVPDGAGPGPFGEDTGWRGVAPPQAPGGQPEPPHLAAGVSLLPTLNWSDCGGAISYGLSVWSDSGPYGGMITDMVEGEPRLNGMTESHCALPDALEPGTKYYWQVYARNLGGETPGPVWEFTTAGAVDPPQRIDIRLEDGVLELTWEHDGEVWIEHTPVLSGNAPWQPLAGPLVGEHSWTWPLPGPASAGFLRLRW